jgi:hypothetical protein
MKLMQPFEPTPAAENKTPQPAANQRETARRKGMRRAGLISSRDDRTPIELFLAGIADSAFPGTQLAVTRRASITPFLLRSDVQRMVEFYPGLGLKNSRFR